MRHLDHVFRNSKVKRKAEKRKQCKLQSQSAVNCLGINSFKSGFSN